MRPIGSVLRARGWRAVALAALVLAACARPQPDLPAGAYLAGDAAALGRALARLEPRSDVPLGRRAAGLRRRIEPCERVYAHSADGSIARLLDALACAPAKAPPDRLRELRGTGDLVLVLPLGQRGRLAGAIRVDERGGVQVDARLEVASVSGPAGLLLPGDVPPGATVLNPDDTLVHARLRSASGLAIADWISDGGQADRMFRLKSELFAGTVLDGTWEVAVYMPETRAQFPPAALAVGFRLRSAAQAAVEAFIAQIRTTWPVQRTSIALPAGEAACLTDLRVLPDLAPCWWLGERALFVAWNQSSLRKALEPGTSAGPDSAGGLIVRLDRFAEADAALQSAAPGSEVFQALDYAWQRLELVPRRSGDALELSLRLVAEAS